VIPVPIEGLQIRHAEPDDYSAVFEIFACPKVIAGTLQLPYPSRELWRKRLAETPEGAHILVAVAGDRIVGMMGLETFPNKPRRRHAATFGMGVHDDWQGKGVGAALMRAGLDLADNWLNITRLELEVYADNEAAIRLYERFGFELEGTLRQHAFRDGKYVDARVMARLRPPPRADE
jgi:L-phenylalanine/L-methionine N-acetyltransferase